ncbi:MAG: hypothetical protein A2X35_09050 [Elusimicrobia bacterium GWA2_61_42]|nr:MAG: hypothetical protein A2X35_09050 [Elusimicrobia bacterium GWA2_61_42]OGR75730.1 MAG: hypothetical protein A2X38_06995 [Elusimicrobia bacterium GWC2_61_25]
MEENTENTVKTAPEYPLPPIRILHLARTGDRAYTATADKYGQVKWNGKSLVAVKGRGLWDIPPVKMELLRQCLEKYDFLNLDKNDLGPYESFGAVCDPDFGSCIITVIFANGTRKTINHNMMDESMPKKLFQLESRIETILGIRKWAGRPPMME